jgi:hypothetical protein
MGRPYSIQKPISAISNIAHDSHAMVASVMSTKYYNISFRRALADDKLKEWLELLNKINNVTLDQEMDMFRWDLKYNWYLLGKIYVSRFVKLAYSIGTMGYGYPKYRLNLKA